jgi:hypothetical protein
LLTWEDCYAEHLRHSQRFASVIAASSQVLVHNASSLTHLRRLGALPDGVGEAVAPPLLGVEFDLPVSASPPASDYVCTTGFIDDRILLNEMLDRIAALVRSGHAARWIHVGTVQPQMLSLLVRFATMVGLADRMSVTGWVPSEVLASTVAASRGVVKPAGRVETGIGVMHANRWGVPVSVPLGYPVRPERSLEAIVSNRDPHPAPRLLLPERSIGAALERFVA